MRSCDRITGSRRREKSTYRTKPTGQLFEEYYDMLSASRPPQQVYENKPVLEKFRATIGELPPTPELAIQFSASYKNLKAATRARNLFILKGFYRYSGLGEIPLKIKEPSHLKQTPRIRFFRYNKINLGGNKMAKIWLEHIHIVTLDPMKLASFYEKVFEAKITRTGTFPDGGVSVSLDLAGTRIAIMVPDTPDKRDPADNPHKHFGLEHLGIRTDDAESLIKRAVAAGATIMENAAPPGIKLVYIMTPENIMIEVTEVKG